MNAEQEKAKLRKNFKKYVKDLWGYDIEFVESKNPDTFENLFLSEDDLVSKKQVIAILESMHHLHNYAEFTVNDVYERGLNDINKLTVCKATMKTGTWMIVREYNDKRSGYFKCSCCGDYNGEDTPYCPYCGSKNARSS